MSISYFAYGSNMDKTQMEYRDVKYTQMFSGILRNWKLVFNKKAKKLEGVGWANIVLNGPDVEGIIYEIDEKSITNLDYWEGYPDEYDKKELFVESKAKSVKCVVYIANPNKVKEGLKPTRKYLERLLAGREFLSENYVSFLEQIQTSG